MPIIKNSVLSGIYKSNTILKKDSLKKISHQKIGINKADISEIIKSQHTPNGVISFITGVFAGISAGIHKNMNNRAISKIDKKFDALKENLPMVRDKFQEVFMRDDIDIKETSKMLDRYRNIEKSKITGNKEDYIAALFKEAKKNFGFENVNIPLHINDEIEKNPECAGYTKDLMQFGIHIKLNPKKMSHMNIIHHELRHEKQNYLAINYNKEDYIKTSFKAVYERALTNKKDFMHNMIKNKTFEEYFDEMKDIAKDDLFQIEKMYGKLDRANLREKDIPFAKKCLDAKHTRVDGKENYKEYKKNFLEKDAFRTGKIMDTLLG